MATRKCKRGMKKGTRSCRRKPGPKRTGRKCKRGHRKGKKSCRRKPGPKRTGRKRRSRRKSKFRMVAMRNTPRIKNSILDARQNPTRQNLKNLTNLQLDQLCKLSGITGCTTKNRTNKINYMLRHLNKIDSDNPFAKTLVDGAKYDNVVGQSLGMGGNLKLRQVLYDSPDFTKEDLKQLTLDELNHFCKVEPAMGFPNSGCTTKSKSRLIRHILKKVAPGGNVTIDPPPVALDAAEIEGMSGKTLRALCKNLEIGNCTSLGGKRLNTRQQRDRLLNHYGHYPVSVAQLDTADSRSLKKMCKRFGIAHCHSKDGIKTSDAQVRAKLMLTGNVG
tara:strand:+ start:120 stop:1115 length:996 start_codon:yes stop_codon:yes gene_type:complete